MANVQQTTPAKRGRPSKADQEAKAAAQAVAAEKIAAHGVPAARKAPPVARPGAPKAPVAPAKPGAPRPPVPAAMAPKPTNGAPLESALVASVEAPAVKPNADTAKLLATIEAMKGEIAKQTETIAKLSAKPTAFSEEQICEGAPELPAGDWRADYHGMTLPLVCWDIDKRGSVKPYPGTPTICHAFVAIPRDFDIGGKGAAARSSGLLALHSTRREDGMLEGQPTYVSPDELASIWPDEG